MTALAGILSLSPEIDAKALCERILRAQASYSNRLARIVEGPAGAIGGALFATLPEDGIGICVHSLDEGACAVAADIRRDDRAVCIERLNLSPGEADKLSDSALLARQWQESGPEVIPRIYGDFAIAALDHASCELVLARDFLGQRPLFYHATKHFVAFASMPIGLQAIASAPPAPSKDALARYLALDPEITASSYFEGVSIVRPGEIVRIGPGGMRRERYWHPPKQRSPQSQEQIEAAVLHQFDRAVAARLRRVGGLGCHLSGGLDSGAVMASAALQFPTNQSLTAFTSVPPRDLGIHDPPGRFIDEGEHAAAAAGRYANVEHVTLESIRSNPAELWDKAYALFQAPLPNPCNFGWHVQIYDAAKARGVCVLLSGALGNLSVGFDPNGFHAQLLAQGSLLKLWQEIQAWRSRGRSWRSLVADIALPLLPKWLLRILFQLYGRDIDLERASFLAAGARQRSGRAIYDAAEKQCQRDNWTARVETYRLVDFGVLNKGILAGWGIDVRDPTADRELVEFCLTLPDDIFRRDGWNRALARRMFGPRLPDIVTKECRRGYQAADWRSNLIDARSELAAELERVSGVQMVQQLISVADLKASLAALDNDVSLGRADELRLRRGALRGLAAAHFIRKSGGSNA